ncbi:MAG TPA: hypothetical protein VIF62_28990 [Labilithrix sp.]
MTRIAALLLLVFTASFFVSCGGAPPPPPPPAPATAQWQDVFDATPELYIVVRPQALKRDPMYGNFVKALTRMAEARGDVGVTTLQAADGCDEVVLGISHGGGLDEAVFVLRGVSASLDPAKMNDASGHPVFRLVDARSKVQEFEHVERGGAQASMFVLPDRTWVYTLGTARARAREAFAHPFGRPVPKVDGDALALVRLDGASSWVGQLQRGQNLGPVLRKLRALSLALKPGTGGLALTLQYTDEDGAAWGEMQSKRLLEDIARTANEAAAQRRRVPRLFELAKDAKVSRTENAVTVRMALPSQLVQDLPNASGHDLDLPL